MNALSIIAICLVSSAMVQGVGFYIYAAIYKRRYFKQYHLDDVHSMQTISGKASLAMGNKVEGRQKTGMVSGHKQHPEHTQQQSSPKPLHNSPAVGSPLTPVKETVRVNK